MSNPLAVVTGGGKGIGRAVVERLARSGLPVLAVGRDRMALDKLVADLGDRHVSAAVCDVTDEAAVNDLFTGAGPVDVLVNNAGVSSAAPVERTTLADWERQLRVNATGAFLCTRAVLPGMRERGHGRIITVASVAGLRGGRYIAGYTASKHAALGLMRAVAAEVAGTGVTCNAVCPAYVRTAMTERSLDRIVERTRRTQDEALAAIESSSLLGRLIEPDEVAAAVAYLCSEEAAAVNGQSLVLDGGGTTP